MNSAHGDLVWIDEIQGWEPPHCLPGTVTAPTVFLPLKPAVPIRPPLALDRLLSCDTITDGAIAALLRNRRCGPDVRPLLWDRAIDRSLW